MINSSPGSTSQTHKIISDTSTKEFAECSLRSTWPGKNNYILFTKRDSSSRSRIKLDTIIKSRFKVRAHNTQPMALEIMLHQPMTMLAHVTDS